MSTTASCASSIARSTSTTSAKTCARCSSARSIRWPPTSRAMRCRARKRCSHDAKLVVVAGAACVAGRACARRAARRIGTGSAHLQPGAGAGLPVLPGGAIRLHAPTSAAPRTPTSAGDPREVKLLIRVPVGAPAPLPVVVWSHGGAEGQEHRRPPAWSSGARLTAACRLLQREHRACGARRCQPRPAVPGASASPTSRPARSSST